MLHYRWVWGNGYVILLSESTALSHDIFMSLPFSQKSGLAVIITMCLFYAVSLWCLFLAMWNSFLFSFFYKLCVSSQSTSGNVSLLHTLFTLFHSRCHLQPVKCQQHQPVILLLSQFFSLCCDKVPWAKHLGREVILAHGLRASSPVVVGTCSSWSYVICRKEESSESSACFLLFI